MMNGSCDEYELAYNYTCKTLPNPCSHCRCCLQGISLQVVEPSPVPDKRESVRGRNELIAIVAGVAVFTALLILLMAVPLIVKQIRVWKRLKNRRVDVEPRMLRLMITGFIFSSVESILLIFHRSRR